MKSVTLFALSSALLASAVHGATSDPVGYLTIPLPGTGGGAPSKLQIASMGLLPSDSVRTSGIVTSFGSDGTGNFLQDTSATWSAGDYVNGTQVSHLVEITAVNGGNAALVGTLTWITSTASQKLYTSDNISAAGTGASYRVLKAFTVSTLLGNPPTSSVFLGAGNSTDGDNLLILDPETGLYTTFWYKSSGVGGTGWRGTGISNTLAPTAAIHPSDGLVFLRKQSGDGSLVIAGMVKTNKTEVMVQGNGSSTVLNILSLTIPVDQLTFGASGLYTGNASTGLKGAGNSTDADNVLIYNATSGLYTTFWYKNTGVGGTGWRATGVSDPTNYVIPAERAVLIQRKAGPSFSWNVPAPTIGN